MAATSTRSAAASRGPQPWIDLSTGINPVAYPVAELPPETWSRLPTREAEQALLAAAARRYGVGDPATIVAAPGTQALIQLLPRLMPRSRVAIVGPTYAEHELCWRRAGHDVTVVPDLAERERAPTSSSWSIRTIPPGRLIAAAGLRAVDAALLVVDEAFIDFLPPEASLAGDLPANAIVLRSFGKTYGLAGVRLGFAVAPARFAGASATSWVRGRCPAPPSRSAGWRWTMRRGCRRRRRGLPPTGRSSMRCWSRRASRSWAERLCSGWPSHPERRRLVEPWAGRESMSALSPTSRPG